MIYKGIINEIKIKNNNNNEKTKLFLKTVLNQKIISCIKLVLLIIYS